jgi:5-methylcytosine-specific restriction endonuclease McrA
MSSQQYPFPGNPWSAGPCLICGTLFVSPNYADRTCSDACRKRKRTHQTRRQAIARKQRIAARDNYTCQLCGDPVPMSASKKHPDSPTLDHKIPKSAGGPGTQENLQLAHRRCNTAKAALTGVEAQEAVAKVKKTPVGTETLTTPSRRARIKRR